MTKRKLVYNLIYIGVAFAFPALPLRGLKLIGGIIHGATDATKEYAKNEVEKGADSLKDHILDMLNPFN